MTKILEKGTTYDTSSLRCVGWTEGDGTGSEGYLCWNYFDASGRYLGPDENGIEPVWEEEE